MSVFADAAQATIDFAEAMTINAIAARATIADLIVLFDGIRESDLRCEFTDLIVSQCAHCLGHEAWWETKRPDKIYD